MAGRRGPTTLAVDSGEVWDEVNLRSRTPHQHGGPTNPGPKRSLTSKPITRRVSHPPSNSPQPSGSHLLVPAFERLWYQPWGCRRLTRPSSLHPKGSWMPALRLGSVTLSMPSTKLASIPSDARSGRRGRGRYSVRRDRQSQSQREASFAAGVLYNSRSACQGASLAIGLQCIPGFGLLLVRHGKLLVD